MIPRARTTRCAVTTVPWTIALLAVLLAPVARPALGQTETPEEAQQKARDAERQREQAARDLARNHRILEAHAEHAKATAELVAQVQRKSKDLDARFEALLTNDEGKRLARDTAACLTFANLRKDPIVTPEELKVHTSAITSILEGVNDELKRPYVGYLPSDEQKAEVQGHLAWATDRLDRLTKRDAWLTTAIEKAPQDFDLASAKTLEAVIRESEAAQIQAVELARQVGQKKAHEESLEQTKQNERIIELVRINAENERKLQDALARIERMQTEFEAQLKDMKAKSDKQLADAELKYKEALAEIDRQKKLSDAETKARNTEADIKRDQVLADAKKKELKQECHSPKVTKTLAPFITPGYWQPTRNGLAGRKTTEKLGMSLKAITDYGALEFGDHGVVNLWFLACSPANDRPGWGATAHRASPEAVLKKLTPEQIEMIKEAQGYLTRLGPALVEEGMLSE